MMNYIEGEALKPCGALHTSHGGGYINLMTRCNHPAFEQGCMDGKGDCEDYELASEISDDIRHIATQIQVG